tara:strand:- start:364822 stop:365946 length:1125 start_codon:yes stop_codon:yes gene_type:complete
MKNKKAFTLIELLVVISIIALLIGILLPALGSARASAQTLVCSSTLRSMGTASAIYQSNYRDHYPSPVNVGAKYLGSVVIPGEGISAGVDALDGNSTQLAPTQTQDWITPMLGDSLGFSVRRAEKVSQLSNDFGCASTKFFIDAPFPNGNGSGMPEDFESFADEVIIGVKQGSYLMPSGFAHFSNYDPQEAVGVIRDLVKRANPRTSGIQIVQQPTSMLSHQNAPIQPKAFRHKITQVGTVVSDKVMAADGTRFWTDPGEGQVDGLTYNPEIAPRIYGNFTESTPTFKGSTAWGRESPNSPSQTNLELSMRHGDGNVNALYFDSSVRSMSNIQMWTNPNPWHPTGTRWNDGDNTDESIQFMDVQTGNRRFSVIH